MADVDRIDLRLLTLRFLEGMGYEDMARVIGCPVGTVRSRLHYAKRALHSMLKGREHGFPRP